MNTEIREFFGSNESIEKLACHLRSRLGFSSDEILTRNWILHKIVKRLGGKISIKEHGDFLGHNGSLVIYGIRSFHIYLSPFTFPMKDNFSIAHDVGHYMLHYIANRESFVESDMPLIFKRYGTGNIEWQANRFAAALLMPKGPFTEDFHRLRDVELLAGRYGVNVETAKIRLESLGF